MAQHIIKQPNGKYLIFNNTFGKIEIANQTKEGLIDYLVNNVRLNIELEVNGIVAKLDNGEKPYSYSTLTFNEMFDKVKESHGQAAVNLIIETLENS